MYVEIYIIFIRNLYSMRGRTNTYRFFLSVAGMVLSFILPVSGMQQIIGSESLPYTLQMQYTELSALPSGIHPDSLVWKTDSQRHRSRYSNHKQLYLLKSDFTIGDCFKDSLLYLCVPSSAYLCRIYLNGHFLAQRGTEYPHANDFLFTSEYYFIPSAFLNGEVNLLTVEAISHRNNQGPFPRFMLMTRQQAERYTFFHNLLNIDVPGILFALGILIAVFFFLIFIAQKAGSKDLRYLLFAMMSLLYGLSYVDYAFSANIARSDCLQKISMLALMLTLLASSLFVIEYYRIGHLSKKHRNRLLLISLGIALCCLLWVVMNPAWKVANAFNKSVTYFTLPVLFADLSVCIWFLWRHRSQNNVMMVIVYAAAFLGITVDGLELSGSDLQFTPFTLLFMIFTLLYLFSREFNFLVRKLYASETTLRHQNEIMEKTIQERTGELQINNEKLSDAVTELKKLNTVKDRFFSIIAHDIKNPLNSMIGFSDLLQGNYAELSDNERKEFIDQICTASNGLYKLLENLLEWSRIQTGSIKCSPARHPVTDIIQAISPLAESLAVAKGIRLKYTYPEDARIYADRNMLITILRNLMGNAIKFSYPGKEVELIIHTNYPGYTEFIVADQGTGMPPEKAATLFRLDTIHSTPGTHNEQGTGLGLVICKEFIDLQGGTIEVQSQEGKGSRILFRLPNNNPITGTGQMCEN